MLVEDLRQGRHRHLGDPADGLPAHPSGPAQSRAAWLLPGRELQLVSVFRQPGEISAGPLSPAQAMARGAGVDGAGGGVEVDYRDPGQARLLCRETWAWRLCPRRLGRGQRDHRGGERLHCQDLWARPGVRLLADSGDVDGQLCGWVTLPVAARWRLHVVLRLVLRPAAGLAADLGRTDRRAGIG